MLLVASILVASIIEVFLWVVTITAQSDWLSAIWLFAFSVLLLLLCQTFYGEWQALNRLKKQQQWQDLSGQLFDSPSMGLALPHCLDMAGCLPEQFQPLVKVWRENIQAHNSDTEILCLFEQDVMLAIDQLAVQIISKNASAAGVIIAISPFALLDMLLVLWRNLRMLNQINHLYGLSLGYWARIRLIRNIFNTMLYAGASEILADAGNYALGASLTSQLSAKIAQGLGAGVLTARIGLKAMQASRPMPWLSSEKPGLSGITKQLLAELMGQINKKTG
jgi:putative membrane protein